LWLLNLLMITYKITLTTHYFLTNVILNLFHIPSNHALRVSSTNKTDRHDIAEILLKVVLNTINQPTKPTITHCESLYTTFNNISVISWRSVLLVEETAVHGENHKSVASHWQTYIMLYRVHPTMNGGRTIWH
jgi:Na+/serine symporter